MINNTANTLQVLKQLAREQKMLEEQSALPDWMSPMNAWIICHIPFLLLLISFTISFGVLLVRFDAVYQFAQRIM